MKNYLNCSIVNNFQIKKTKICDHVVVNEKFKDFKKRLSAIIRDYE